ncbi:MAG: hypothetical protein GY786_12680 [Proteobacteria bacterium]|nr:hypothetical protein [Pseudomonadota bacterium]
MNILRYISVIGFFLLIIIYNESFAGDAGYVWIEGESAKSGTLNTNHPFVSRNKKLSGGISYGSDKGPYHAIWDVTVKKGGTWHLYIRKFWKHGPFRWRFDKGVFKTLTKEGTMLIDNVSLDRKHQAISWVPLGAVKLGKGTHEFEIEGIEEKGAFVIDCFVLSRDPFEPSGLRKPGEKSGLSDPGRWAFEPDFDRFDRPDSVNLRSLNERIAGESGYINTNAMGEFIRGDGKQIRFWASQGDIHRTAAIDEIKRHAKHLAKRGVNMVRHHGFLNPLGSDPMKTRQSEIEAVQKLVTFMKEEGIYTTVSPYWGSHVHVDDSWEIPGHNKGSLTGMLFWDETLQKYYKKWLKDLLLTPNPYDKNRTPLANDPALAIFQIQNEDSLLFWTVQLYRKQPRKLARLQKRYNLWRKKKGKRRARLNIRMWELNYPSRDQKNTMHFFAELMFEFNKEIARYLREDLGFKGLINAGNWRTANQLKLLDLERWSYTANEVIGVNRYVNGSTKGKPHINPSDRSRVGYALDRGDFFQDISALFDPLRLPITAKQVKGRTFIISESTWVSPFSYQSEGPFLIAAYSALTGIDIFYWFSTRSIAYDKSILKWQFANPAIMGGFPAASLMFRKGYIKKGKTVVHEERSLQDMWDLRSPVISEESGFDANRDRSITPRSAIKGSIDQRAYLVGPVEVLYDGDPVKSRAIDLRHYIKGNTVKSVTGEISIDTDKGLSLLNAPKAQGVTGFLKKAGTITTDNLSIKSNNEYATVLAVSIDEKPLGAAKKILLQITTRNRPYGWRDSPWIYEDPESKMSLTGFRIDNPGSSPWNVWNTDMTITVNNKHIKKATLLDENLYPTLVRVKEKKLKDGLTIIPPANAMYMLLE